MPGKPPLTLKPPPLERIHHEFLTEHDVNVSVLRLDQIHPLINGNKWFKLRRNIEFIQQQQIQSVLSFGGAWSNHLRALAAAGKLFDFRTIGVVRGELVEPLNPVLRFAREQGMELLPISRELYRQKQSDEVMAQLQQQFGEFYCLPEGGSNRLAVEGCADIASHLRWTKTEGPKFVVMACGTGASLAGVILGLRQRGSSSVRVKGISVLKAPGYLAQEVSNWLDEFDLESSGNWQVLDHYHGGGYAKVSPAMEDFLNCYRASIDIPVEPVYTGKVAYGLWDMIAQGEIASGAEVIAVHTGGIVN